MLILAGRPSACASPLKVERQSNRWRAACKVQKGDSATDAAIDRSSDASRKLRPPQRRFRVLSLTLRPLPGGIEPEQAVEKGRRV